MLNTYILEVEITYKDYIASSYRGKVIIEDFEAKESTRTITWDNIEELSSIADIETSYDDYRKVTFKNNISNIISIDEKIIKDMVLLCNIKYFKTNMSLEEIFKYHDGEIAIKYLNQFR